MMKLMLVVIKIGKMLKMPVYRSMLLLFLLLIGLLMRRLCLWRIRDLKILGGFGLRLVGYCLMLNYVRIWRSWLGGWGRKLGFRLGFGLISKVGYTISKVRISALKLAKTLPYGGDKPIWMISLILIVLNLLLYGKFPIWKLSHSDKSVDSAILNFITHDNVISIQININLNNKIKIFLQTISLIK